ncbi:DsbA family protein [Rhizobium sp. AAP43]|uniref:DsbA family protein n=1 Tax=Rhizobium sp. AAP43 TaxID=1523420 RepID=UPI0006B978AE|nr:DsbA family protein [Rhizobium sp. AAP43]KPF43041.1 disulfide bond formation protein DsbA [Rhizobium sp. AAP43]
MALNFKMIAATTVALLPFMLPVAAHALDDAQKKEFGAFIREYLLENPEVLVEAQQALQEKQETARMKQAKVAVSSNTDKIFKSTYDVAIGNPKGDVTVVEFFDYNCGYCRRAHADMEAVLEQDKNIRYVLKEFPILGPDSEAAHKVSDAFRKLSPEKYGDFFRAMMTSEGRASEESAIAIASDLGVSEEKIRAKMAESPNTASVEETYRLAADLGITGTPSYVIGDEMLPGAVGTAALSEKLGNVRSCGQATC